MALVLLRRIVESRSSDWRNLNEIPFALTMQAAKTKAREDSVNRIHMSNWLFLFIPQDDDRCRH
jgi:hypothetical protein